MPPACSAAPEGGPSTALTAIIVLLGLLYFGLFLIPSISVVVRRFHDQDMSGWFYLLAFVPFGSIVMIVFMCRKGTDGPNRFGDDPLNPQCLGEIFS